MSAEATTCPRCAAIPPPNARFCPQCGAPLGAPAPTGERRPVAIVFADLSGFTSLSEREERSRSGQDCAAEKAKHRDSGSNQHERPASGPSHGCGRLRERSNAIGWQVRSKQSLRNNLNRDVQHDDAGNREEHRTRDGARGIAHLTAWLQGALDAEKREDQQA